MHIGIRWIGAGLVAAFLAACDGGAGPAPDALSARIDALEKRLAAAERANEPVERLRNDAASLDRRMSALETSVRELSNRPAAPGAPAAGALPGGPRPGAGVAPGPHDPATWSGPAQRPDRTVRRAELRALSDEFRTRLTELRNTPGATDNPEKTREILDWYREQRRAILRGEGRTDQ